MKHNFCYILISLFLISCNSKAPIEVKQIVSNEIVTILPSLKNPSIKDSIVISIPTEFEIIINYSVSYIAWHYSIDGKILWDDFVEYQVYNKQNKTKPIHQLNFNEALNDKSINIIIKERNHLISKKNAQELLKKYDINRSLDNLKFKDTIKLTTYDKFRIENKEMINDFNKINDSIKFRVMKGDGSFFYIDKKINW
ncbi:hypothetical protein OIU80_10690 [Flavobacterium sp. LS1R47]|uniref:DUF3261 domain-containing protein n=1 Tax=Flavobacterium frigoritolerans TaxID=2987686 RepID=A0A9X2ZL43_9FLAO|nr:hypothetical protein [Flavobacterium frigoritolerans]MCV9932750.1 hypothetical protein [Flavobacterium frigoritolerans]